MSELTTSQYNRPLSEVRHESVRLAIEASAYNTDGTKGDLLSLAHLIFEWIEKGTYSGE